MHDKLLKLAKEVWYNIPLDRPDRAELILAIEKQIELFGNFQFNEDKTKFRLVKSRLTEILEWNQFISGIDDPTEISYKIEFRDQKDVLFDYSNLAVKIKMDDGKKKKRRAV